jgi:hypothetical protein
MPRLFNRLTDFFDARKTAEIAMNERAKACADNLAIVVLPTPGGPHKIMECG